MPKLTKRIVDTAEARPAEYFVWDSDIPGFGLRVRPSGRKGYVVQYHAGRRSRRISLGPSTVLTCEQARTRAITIVAAARNGEAPAAERGAGRKAITVKELAERFDKEHIVIRVKASTGEEYRRNPRRFILPALGQLTVTGSPGRTWQSSTTTRACRIPGPGPRSSTSGNPMSSRLFR